MTKTDALPNWGYPGCTEGLSKMSGSENEGKVSETFVFILTVMSLGVVLYVGGAVLTVTRSMGI